MTSFNHNKISPNPLRKLQVYKTPELSHSTIFQEVYLIQLATNDLFCVFFFRYTGVNRLRAVLHNLFYKT